MPGKTKRPPPPADYDPNPEWTEADFAQARPADQMPPEMLAFFPKTARRLRGPQKAPVKVPVHIRLARDLVEHYRASGRGWQARLEADLRRAAGLESTGTSTRAG